MNHNSSPRNHSSQREPTRSPEYRTADEVVILNRFGLSRKLIDALPSEFHSLFPVQQKVIPRVIAGADNIVALAPTGQGKTFAYGIALLERLNQMPGELAAGTGLIVVPSTQLAEQVFRVLSPLAHALSLTVSFLRDDERKAHVKTSAEPPGAILIGTPKSLLLGERSHAFRLHSAAIVVLDEGDYLLGDDLHRETHELLDSLRPFEDRHMLLLSGTLPSRIIGRVAEVMPGATVINLGIERPLDKIQHFIAHVAEERDAHSAAVALINQERIQKGIIFCGSTEECDEVSSTLARRGIRARSLHENIAAEKRIANVMALREGTAQILVATSASARGLDVYGLTHVINLAVPQFISDYTQQAGRTGRRGEGGTCITIVPPVDRYDFEAMMTILKVKPETYQLHHKQFLPQQKQTVNSTSPAALLAQVESRFAHSFSNPGLVLTSLNLNSRFFDPRESAPMLNLVGREVAGLLAATYWYFTKRGGSTLPPEMRHGDVGFQETALRRLIDSFGVRDIAAPDKDAAKGFLERRSNTEQSVYNLLGALYIDSDSLSLPYEALTSALQISAEVRQSEQVFRTRVTIAARCITTQTQRAIEAALRYDFKSPGYLWETVGLLNPGHDSGMALVRAHQSLGREVFDLYFVDATRRTFLGDGVGFVGGISEALIRDKNAPQFIRARRNELGRLDYCWSTPEFLDLSSALEQLSGWQPSENPARASELFRRIMAGVYLDGGFAACSAVLGNLFPELRERGARATDRLTTSFDPALLQECLTEAGEVRIAQMEARRRAIEGQVKIREAKDLVIATRPVAPLSEARVTQQALLESHISKVSPLPKLKISTTRLEGQAGFSTRVLVNKREISEAASAARKESIEEACRLALAALGHGNQGTLEH